METHLGMAAKALGLYMATPVFDGAVEKTAEYQKTGFDRTGNSN